MLRNSLERDLGFAPMGWFLSRRKGHFYLVLRTSSKNGIFETGRRIGNCVAASAPDAPISRDSSATWLLPSNSQVALESRLIGASGALAATQFPIRRPVSNIPFLEDVRRTK